MQKKIALRFILGILTIVALFGGYRLFHEFAKDPDLGEFASVGMVAAIEYTPEGGRVVVIDEQGKEITPPAPEKSFDDLDVTWSVDGNRLFFSSTRESEAYTIHRWNPGKNVVERRTAGSRSQSLPWFGPNSDPRAKQYGLILSGGNVLEVDARTGATTTVLPPTTRDLVTGGGEESGAQSPMESTYRDLGDSFKFARWGPGRESLFAIMRKEENNVAIHQSLGLDAQGQQQRPVEIFRGRNVILDVDDQGVAAVSVQGFFFRDPAAVPEQFIQNGKIVKPFESGVFKVSIGPEGQPNAAPVALVPADSPQSFGDVSISPDGTKVAVVVGSVDKNGNFIPAGIAVMPFEEGGAGNGTLLVQGAVSSVSWSPDGSKLVYLMTEGSNTDIYTIGSDGSGTRKVTSGGRFAFPRISPQMTSE
ncbi:MAG: hypothetical protein LCH41_02235 [Armatimonadetes bacterium]|nr:hypothetical protein [Armatimonadota bacterium]